MNYPVHSGTIIGPMPYRRCAQPTRRCCAPHVTGGGRVGLPNDDCLNDLPHLLQPGNVLLKPGREDRRGFTAKVMGLATRDSGTESKPHSRFCLRASGSSPPS